MSLKSHLKAIVPDGLWRFAGFCKRLPAYWLLDRSENLRVREGLDELAFFVTPEIHVKTPRHLSAFIYWQTHALRDPSSAKELRDFIDLSQGKTSFIDIGAQTGFLSAVFSKLVKGPARIASLEPDPQVHRILAEAKTQNQVTGVEWQIIHSAVSNSTGKISMPIFNSVIDEGFTEAKLGDLIEVESTTLEDLIEQLGWVPDLIKIDVESHEHEILCSSWDVLTRVRPAIQLEVHWQLLRSRGLDGLDSLKHLHDIGYRGIRRSSLGFDQWKKLSETEGVSRLSLNI